ncbi:hypothetical protein LOK49_LG10G02823 [Camellia lanceoleosa]|uniref:Uncharacterized protein n=1 Tax=Camellia lanceoleosa TaxID=1840588 RepID=A0ACC0G9C2_9ERIC|nr:hypothetical protein LOK49_LG10G02823 [Camellia lanceoleosa]
MVVTSSTLHLESYNLDGEECLDLGDGGTHPPSRFSLPVWVEEGPLVEPAALEIVGGGGGGTNKDGRDLLGPSQAVILSPRRDGGVQSVEAQANPVISRVFSTLKDGFGPRPDNGSLPVLRDSMGNTGRLPTGPQLSSGVVNDAPSDLEGVEQYIDEATEQRPSIAGLSELRPQ